MSTPLAGICFGQLQDKTSNPVFQFPTNQETDLDRAHGRYKSKSQMNVANPVLPVL